ncbi:MAG: hypothetical protein COS76_04270 [Candidatus Portnoybacteria bacterium CG06_land_8_20_14_3_00_39_12]|uniref:Uncharacterized protein n=2 Tax=Candidatus Portnoyibacteriota TaxID=1817913 RepID=A0A2M7UGN6_9BACT|nr:MAG: hypothetical protein COS76_04270 [Candidatus Portnoybacteria bacterium CG06_land_8_20_14_3_00_39_12]PIZ70387.1 MAG: hypothetical protein COY09_03115 [Candidatus Portnoybacteria bacterium CG_4_10_14_0_2_um_filter_39_11]
MINLLPPFRKQDLRREFMWRRLGIFLWMLFFVLIIFSGLLFTTWSYTNIQHQAFSHLVQIEESSNQGQKIKGIEQEIKEANIKLKYLDQLKLNQEPTFMVVNNLSNFSSRNIIFRGLSINRATKKGSIEGFAKNRDDLLNLKQNMEQSNNFSQIDLPLNSLLKEKDLNFNLSFSFK